MTDRPTRRSVLRAAAAAAVLTGAGSVAACTGSETDAAPSPSPTPVDPDVALRADAMQRERLLLATYDAAIATTPALAELLSPLRAEHAEHLAALERQGQPVLPDGSFPADASTSASPTPAPVMPPIPRPGLGTVIAVERRAATEHAESARTASPALAQVLASLAASEASHEIALAVR